MPFAAPYPRFDAPSEPLLLASLGRSDTNTCLQTDAEEQHSYCAQRVTGHRHVTRSSPRGDHSGRSPSLPPTRQYGPRRWPARRPRAPQARRQQESIGAFKHGRIERRGSQYEGRAHFLANAIKAPRCDPSLIIPLIDVPAELTALGGPGASSKSSNKALPSFLNVNARPFVPAGQAVPAVSSTRTLIKKSHEIAPPSNQQSNGSPTRTRRKRKGKHNAGKELTPSDNAAPAKSSNISSDVRHDSPVQHVKVPFRPSPRRTDSKPRLYWLPEPIPTKDYLTKAAKAAETSELKQSLLVILDLNGTLLFRKQKGGSKFVGRPRVDAFIDYLFTNHRVMVWSSARPVNVDNMCKQLFSPAQSDKLVAVWARDRLRLSEEAYNNKVQVYKQLSWVWQDAEIQKLQEMRAIPQRWSQANTVLIDDSVEKAASEPHNIVQIEEFEARPEQMETDVLGQVMEYLDILRTQKDVSAYMREHPFVCESVAKDS